MRKAILMMLLAVVSNSAIAEWVQLENSDIRSRDQFYYDPTSISRKGDISKMVILIHLSSREFDEGKESWIESRKFNAEYNCVEDLWKMLSLYNYKNEMGNGKLVSKDTKPTKWMPTNGGLQNLFLDIACKEK